MDFQLSQKETMLLEDAKKQEELCIVKYESFANQAKDPKLKQLLNSLGSQEEEHLNTVNTLLQGKAPNLSSSSSTKKNQSNSSSSSGNTSIRYNNPDDATMLTDLLSTEKYVSSLYDTSIFESANKPVRDALQHIQKKNSHMGSKYLII